MAKYREYFENMLNDNKEVFGQFRRLHDNYSVNPEVWQEKFNSEGEKILEIVREYENRLCANTERGQYNKYSAKLAEKFKLLVRQKFPMIDYIGLKVNSKNRQDDFFIKKINLN